MHQDSAALSAGGRPVVQGVQVCRHSTRVYARTATEICTVCSFQVAERHGSGRSANKILAMTSWRAYATQRSIDQESFLTSAELRSAAASAVAGVKASGSSAARSAASSTSSRKSRIRSCTRGPHRMWALKPPSFIGSSSTRELQMVNAQTDGRVFPSPSVYPFAHRISISIWSGEAMAGRHGAA